MARVANSMVTFQDLDDMVSFEGFSYATNPIRPPSNLNTCATKLDVLGYLDANLSRNTADNQLVSYSIIVLPSSNFDVNPKLFNTSRTSKTLNVLIEAGGDWTITIVTGGNWLIVAPNTGSGDTNYGIFVDINNNPAERSGTVRFTETSSGDFVDVVINQAGFGV